jgi:hypothetical protein
VIIYFIPYMRKNIVAQLTEYVYDSPNRRHVSCHSRAKHHTRIAHTSCTYFKYESVMFFKHLSVKLMTIAKLFINH